MKLYSSNKNVDLYQGNMLDMLDVIEENSIDSIVCDPPYELNFMNKNWDNTGIAFQKETREKCFKVLKPGGHLLAFGGSRTFHRIACAIEDAGFEIRDTIMWLYGCYSSDTQVLTDKGWRYFYDLDKTEKVLQYNKNTNELSWVKPLNYFEYDIDDNMQIFKTENSEQFITCNHTVLYKTKNINNITQTNNANLVVLATIIYKDVYLPIYKDNSIIWEKIIDTNEVDYKGKVYCLQTETGAFVVRRNNQAFISGNSGFPKSMNIGKVIESKLLNGSARIKDIKKLDGVKTEYISSLGKFETEQGYTKENYIRTKTEVNYKTDLGKQWQCWGDSIKAIV